MSRAPRTGCLGSGPRGPPSSSTSSEGRHSAGTSEKQFGTAPPVDDGLVEFPSVCREVVQQSFGLITLDSEPQKAGRRVDDLVLVIRFAAHTPFARGSAHGASTGQAKIKPFRSPRKAVISILLTIYVPTNDERRANSSIMR